LSDVYLPGSTVPTAWPIISLKISISQLSLPLIFQICAPSLASGWDKLRLLSAGHGTFKYDLGSEDREGHQDSTVSVFTRDADGTARHFYTAHPRLATEIPARGIDLLAPIWHFLDLTPQGRGKWYANLAYGTKVQAASK
jgi:predicted dithiol-disulfide oxidoreductase (DUF899 family)